MVNHITHKGYKGTVEYSADDNCHFGKIVGINDLVSYEAQSLEELKTAFKEAVEDYLVNNE